MANQPSMNQRGLVSPVVVEDQVEVEIPGHVGIDGVEEFSELGSVSAGAPYSGTHRHGRGLNRGLMALAYGSAKNER
jgi:hypothetical protein